MEAATIDKPEVNDSLDKDNDGAGVETQTVEETPKKKRATKRAAGKGTSKVKEQEEDNEAAKARQEAERRKKEMEEAQAELEALSPSTEPVRWMIGKKPENGGTEKQWSVYVQDKLPYIDRMKFFSLVSRTFAEAIKQSGGAVGGMGDIFGDEEGGSLIERGRRLTQRDLTDASQFMALAFELVGYVDTFLIDCYVIMLNVPRAERQWARNRFNETWDPDNEKWGLTDEEHERILEIFIDQNYEEIRSFFVVTLPNMGRRIALHEKSRDRESKSDQSK